MRDVFVVIDSILTCLPVSIDEDGEFITWAILRTIRVFFSRWHRHGKVPLDLDLDVLVKIEDFHHVFFDLFENEDDDEDEDFSSMIPALDSSVQSLLKKYEGKEIDYGDTNRESCCICLEELSEDLLSMPCEHVFHDNCIKGWLSTSHYCPICRFEMPVAHAVTE
ncbi:hypothetical protein ACS0TY_017452 [Phlomoides rotata]